MRNYAPMTCPDCDRQITRWTKAEHNGRVTCQQCDNARKLRESYTDPVRAALEAATDKLAELVAHTGLDEREAHEVSQVWRQCRAALDRAQGGR